MPKKWNGDAAAALFRGPVLKALKAKSPGKKQFTIVEDNDPTGYTSKKAVAAKEDSKITTPDLNPLDFFLWSEVELILQTACN